MGADKFVSLSGIGSCTSKGCILGLLVLNYIPQRSHHSLTLPRTRFRDSASAALELLDGTPAIKLSGVISTTEKIDLQHGKSLRDVQ